MGVHIFVFLNEKHSQDLINALHSVPLARILYYSITVLESLHVFKMEGRGVGGRIDERIFAVKFMRLYKSLNDFVQDCNLWGRRVMFESLLELSLPIASQSLACSASTAGTLSLTEVDAASSERALSRRTEAAIELAPSAIKINQIRNI